MKYITLLSVTVLFLASSLNCLAKKKGESHFAAGVRRHMAQEEFADLPYQDDDYSFGLAYEYHESVAYWQLALNVLPDLEGADMVITPAINLIAKEDIWRAGIGMLDSYVLNGPSGDEWTGVYWQMMLGIGFPVAGIPLEFMANYTLETWDEIGEFEAEALEYGIWVRLPF